MRIFRDISLFQLFLAAFCFKQGLPLVFGGGFGVILAFILLFLGIWALSNRIRRVVILVFVFQVWIVYTTWPWTINHRFLELYISLMLVVLGFKHAKGQNVKPELQTSIMILQIGVWSMAALHKLVYGYYLNGSLLLFWKPYDAISEVWGGIFGKVRDAGINGYIIDCDTGMNRFLRSFLCGSIIITELIAAVLCAFRKWWAVVCVMGIQIIVAIFSAEWDFACVNLICISALDERVFRRTWITVLLACSLMTVLSS